MTARGERPAPTQQRESRWRGLVDRLTRSEAEIDAEQLQHDADRIGATHIDELQDREVASVCGDIRSVSLRPKANVPALVVDLYDGSRSLNLVWLGRRSIRGIEPGVFVKARGRVTYLHKTPTIFNPSYEIVPDRGRRANS